MRPEADAMAHERSRAIWGAMAPSWEAQSEFIRDVGRSISEHLIAAVKPQPGDVILELAAGPGEIGLVVASLVGERGRVLITDFAPEMVAAARRQGRELGIGNAEFRVLDAERMELDTDTVDGVVCRWGYMLMMNPAAAFAETRRVLRPGGRLAFSVFADPQANPWAAVIGRILVARGHLPPPDPHAPGIFAFADSERIRQLLSAAGFGDLVIENMDIEFRFGDFDAYWAFLTEMAGAISPVLRALEPAEQEQVRARLVEAIEDFKRDEGYVLPGRCLNVTASLAP
jgi:ubiquinone/menaquinone biosynthesis C-methylase UbiE